MKEKFTKSIKQKMFIIPMMIVMLFNFIFPNYSQADVGGVLATPLIALLAMFGDAANRIIYTTVGSEQEESQIKSVFGIGEYEIYLDKDDDKAAYIRENKATGDTDYEIDTDEMRGDYGIPNIRITPAEIFANNIPMLNANFFADESELTGRSIVGTLKETVSSWYNTLRMIALAGLLSVLAYIGIRVMLSSAAADKAKYKERAKDWFVAMCLVFFLHYIMVFIMTSVDEITTMLSNSNSEGRAEQVSVTVTDGDNPDTVDGEEVKFYTNLTGYIRLCVEYKDLVPKFSALIMYLGLTFYTVYFVFIYLKRLLTLVFLTLIAPLVALTYPLDKLKDGKAQAFNYWLREYAMNAMLPIIHLILYTILVTSAADLIKKAPLYAIIAMGFIVPAEKIVKDMFGFKSAMAPGGGFAGGVMASQLMSAYSKSKGSGKGSSGGSGDSGKEKIKSYADKGKIDSSYSDLAIGTGNNQNGQSNNGAYSQAEQMANQDAGQDEMHNWEAEPRGYSQAEQMANLDAGQDEMHSWESDTGDTGNVGDTSNVGGIGDDGNADGGDRANWNFGEGIAEATDRGAREAFPRANAIKNNVKKRAGAIKNNAKKMVQRRYRAAGGAKGIAKKAGKKLGRGALKVATKAPAIMAGVALGVAGGMVSGDLKDMWKGLAGGVVAGNALGNTMANKAENALNRSTTRHSWDELMHGEDKADEMARVREFKSNKSNIEYWESKNQIRDGETQDQYIKRRDRDLENMSSYSEAAGGNIKKIDKLYKMEKGMLQERGLEGLEQDNTKEGRARYESERVGAQKYAEQIAKLSEQYSSSDLRGSKKNDVIQAHKEKLMNAGLNENDATARAGTIVNQIKEYNGWV